MLYAISIVFCLALLGDVIVDALGAPIPGATVGMVLLVGLFVQQGGPDRASARLFDGVAPHFPLFFVPAAAGLVTSGDLPALTWVHVATAILLSTLAAIVVTGLLIQAVLDLNQTRREAS